VPSWARRTPQKEAANEEGDAFVHPATVDPVTAARPETLVVSSPVGDLTLTAEGGALIGVDLGLPSGSVADESFPVGLVPTRADPSLADLSTADAVLGEAARQLSAYFSGDLRDFDLPLRLRGTPFQTGVWQALREIPYGRTISYGELARTIGRPGAARAVGRANAQNPLAIVVPCHRVIGGDGGLTGYVGGLGAKAALLALEAGSPPRTRAPGRAPGTGSRAGSAPAVRTPPGCGRLTAFANGPER
jgi:methylated-DNA-[protein]-cysteine S-methyltransferase